MALAIHPYASMFPRMEGEKFLAFVDDIRTKGMQEEIVLLEGAVLDGANRYSALQIIRGDELKLVAGEFRDFNPATEGDPLDWVLSRNIHRRHMDDGQRAMVAASLVTMPGHRPDKGADRHTSVDDAAARLNVSKRLVQRARQILETGSPDLVRLVRQGHLAVDQGERAAKENFELQAKVVDLVEQGLSNAARTATKQAARDTRERELGKRQRDLPDKKFGVILADPEWEFTVFSMVTGMDRSADNHYPTSSEQEISARDVEKIAAKDCMLCLWVTDLARGIRVMEAWGFEFKSYFVWVKDIVAIDLTPEQRKTGLGDRTFIDIGPAGTGFWNRDRDELLLIGTRGKFVAPALGTQPESVVFAARPKIEGTEKGRHSAKPDFAHVWIEKNWPSLPKIELNARQAREGWEVWGYEAPDPVGQSLLETAQDSLQEAQAIVQALGSAAESEQSEGDKLYSRAVAIVRTDNKPSVSYLQRVLKIKYSQAETLIDRMVHDGIVSAANNRGLRQVLPQKVKSAAAPEFDGDRDMPAFLSRGTKGPVA